MLVVIWGILGFIGILTLAYQAASLTVWTSAAVFLLLLYTFVSESSLSFLFLLWVILLLVVLPLNILSVRQRWLSAPLLRLYRRYQPKISRTEKEALEAGTVGWEGELFSGNPRWEQLLAYPKPVLTADEQAFLEGPVETLCRMIDDWDITHCRADLPPEMWQFLKENGFWGLIVPKKYGGKEFSALAHSAILVKIAGLSASVATIVSVPNSLGPAELLLHYGTEEQKNYYLPRLARGEEIPCFALTSATAGSDAGAMPDYGIVCKGLWEDKEVLGIRLNWDKRYITLAPVATVLGLAFKLEDPDHLLGDEEKLGITCALIPMTTSGITVGRRHFPLNAVFQNGPTQGKDVFIPLDYIIGGASMAGHGWQMLMECLSAGRGISLPSISLGGALMAAAGCGAYGMIRRQFKRSIGEFEGIEEVLTRIIGHSWLMDATRLLTISQIDSGEKPSVATALTKYHVTELGRKVSNDAMDVHGGKGICLGQRNYLGRNYQSIPISITVEGANILTRSMIIFGQGVIRCHPFILAEMIAAAKTDPQAALNSFDEVFWKHIAFTITNKARVFLLALTDGRIADVPSHPMTKRYFQQFTRYSAALAFLSDVTLVVLGAKLKEREILSARLGDILSYLYMGSAVLKHFADEGYPEEELPLLDWNCQMLLYQIQEQIDGILRNFPARFLAIAMRSLFFPWGRRAHKPNDALSHRVASLLLRSSNNAKRRLLDDVLLKLLPQAFSRSKIVGGYIDCDHHWLVINTASGAQAEEFTQLLRQSLSSLKLAAFFPDSMSHTLTEWVKTQRLPSRFNIESYCEMHDPDAVRTVIRCINQDLAKEEVQKHLEAGKKITQLELTWNDQLTFIIDHTGLIKRIRFLELMEETQEALEAETVEEQFTADFTLMSATFVSLLAALTS